MRNQESAPLMKKIRGIKLGRKVKMVFRWVIRPKPRSVANPISGIMTAIRHLQRKAQTAISSPRRELISSSGDCIHLGRAKTAGERSPPPKKGHLAVYVGESDDEARRVMVPLIYFNHPLFGELLEEAERVHGFDHPGGISIPCGYSKFEKVRMRIDAWDGGFRSRRRAFFRHGGLVR